MMMKRIILTWILTGILGLAQAQDNAVNPEHIESVTAISKVLGDGRKVATLVLEYGAPISNKSLTSESFRVEGREVTRIYSSPVPERADRGEDGRYVIIEVKAEVDLNAQPRQHGVGSDLGYDAPARVTLRRGGQDARRGQSLAVHTPDRRQSPRHLVRCIRY